MKALLLSAGFGTRLQPFTNHHPKALAKVGDQSLLEINIRNLQKFGIFDVVVNVHHFADQIEETLYKHEGFGSRFEISDERNQILETGGGLKKAAQFLEGENDFLMMNVDILSNFNLHEMLDWHLSKQSLATLAVQKRNSKRYLLMNANLNLKGWENVQTKERKLFNPENEVLEQYAFSGIQILNRSIFQKMDKKEKFSIIELYLKLCTTELIAGWDHTGDLLLDVGKPERLDLANKLWLPQININSKKE